MRSIDSVTGLLYTVEQSASGIDLMTAAEDRSYTPLGSRWLRPDYGTVPASQAIDPDELVDSIRAAMGDDPRLLDVTGGRAGDALEILIRGLPFEFPAAAESDLAPLSPVTPVTPAVPEIPLTPATPVGPGLSSYWGISPAADDLTSIDLTATAGVVVRDSPTGSWIIAGIPASGLWRPYVLTPAHAAAITIGQPPFGLREAYTVHAYEVGDRHYLLYRYTAEARVTAEYNGVALEIT